MREFFQGWRRKAGCVALVMALAVSTAWMRSYWINDKLGVVVIGGVVHVLTIGEDHEGSEPDFFLYPTGGAMASQRIMMLPDPGKLPYPAIAIPLTLLSAYLILWKPRPKAKPNV